MARAAQAEKVARSIGFLIPLDAKLTKRDNMVNIEVMTQLRFSNIASLAGIVIAIPGIATLLLPIRAVINFISALPVGGVFTREGAGLRAPSPVTFPGAKHTALGMYFRDMKFLATLLTSFRDAFLKIGSFAGNFWPRDTLFGFGKMLTKTFAGAETPTRPLVLGHLYSALLTVHWRKQYNAEILNSINGGRAGAGAIDARLRSMMPEAFAASWTNSPDMVGSCHTFSGTEMLTTRIRRTIINHRLVTMFTV